VRNEQCRVAEGIRGQQKAWHPFLVGNIQGNVGGPQCMGVADGTSSWQACCPRDRF
jgi:hypothetical protein